MLRCTDRNVKVQQDLEVFCSGRMEQQCENVDTRQHYTSTIHSRSHVSDVISSISAILSPQKQARTLEEQIRGVVGVARGGWKYPMVPPKHMNQSISTDSAHLYSAHNQPQVSG